MTPFLKWKLVLQTTNSQETSFQTENNNNMIQSTSSVNAKNWIIHMSIFGSHIKKWNKSAITVNRRISLSVLVHECADQAFFRTLSGKVCAFSKMPSPAIILDLSHIPCEKYVQMLDLPWITTYRLPHPVYACVFCFATWFWRWALWKHNSI